MRFRILAVLAILAATLAVVAGAGPASATTASTQALDLSTPAAVDAYLTSIGVDPSTVVKQIGLFNYAGPNCPGPGWNCTTSNRVVQMSKPGGENHGECASDPMFTTGQSCLIMQTEGGRNTAKCTQKSQAPAAELHCRIVQSGVRNFAMIDQDVDQKNTATQTAILTAIVTQDGATDKNESQIHQDVDQTTSVGAAQDQEVHVAATVDQTASGRGNNFSHVLQTQDQKAFGATTSQDQNSATTLPTGFTDCAPSFPTAPNSCANVKQTADAGDNFSHLHAFGSEDENTKSSATQKQGDFANGFEGDVHLMSTTGASRNFADLRKQQHMSSTGGVQTQVDPVRCCGTSTIGNPQSKENIDETSTQSAKGGASNQNADLIGNADSSGPCSISQHARQNQAATNVSASEPGPCPALALETTCESYTGEIGNTGSCSTCPPDCPDLAPVIPSITAGTPTYGAVLPPLDFSLPSSYTLPSWYENF
jgi:hypothetical protein